MDCCYGLKRYTPRAVRWGIKGLASCSIASQNMRCVQLTGSCDVRSLAWKSYTAISRAKVLKYGLVSRKEKNSRSVVFCISKGYGAAEVALRGRLAILRFPIIWNIDWNSIIQNAKSASASCERCLIPPRKEGGAMEAASQSCLFGKTTEVLSGT